MIIIICQDIINQTASHNNYELYIYNYLNINLQYENNTSIYIFIFILHFI